jgi:hypothetical protein
MTKDTENDVQGWKVIKKRGTVATVQQPTTQNYVNSHYFMALSHTFYTIKGFLSKNEKKIKSTLFRFITYVR